MDDYKKIEEHYAKKHGSAANKTKKSIGDFTIDEKHPVNVKSNNVEKKNYSPNIISAKRLLLWLGKAENKLSFIFVDYKIESGGKIKIIKDTGLVPVEHLSWECLTIEAQGWGVIQMVGKLKVDKTQNRKTFLHGLKKAYQTFLSKERKKMAAIEKLIKDL